MRRLLLRMLLDVEGEIDLLEVLTAMEAMRRMLLCMLEALEVLEVMHCVLLCMLEAVEDGLCLLEVPQACVLCYSVCCKPWKVRSVCWSYWRRCAVWYSVFWRCRR